MTKAAITPFPLRLAPDLRGKLDAAAKRSGRSLQSEITARLESTFHVNLGPAATGMSLDAAIVNYDQLAELLVQRLSGEGLLVKVEPGKIVTKRITRTPPKPKG